MEVEEDPQVAQKAKELADWREKLSTKKGTITFLDEIRREVITCHKPENFIQIMDKYIW